jgi:hypothetical protein
MNRENKTLTTLKKTKNSFENTRILIQVMLYTTLLSHFIDVVLSISSSINHYFKNRDPMAN